MATSQLSAVCALHTVQRSTIDDMIMSIVCVFLCRLINTGLYLLQDESQQVRMRVAGFASTLCHARRGRGERSVYLMQVNQALPFLLELLLEECWDSHGTLEVLLSHLPESDLRAALREARETE